MIFYQYFQYFFEGVLTQILQYGMVTPSAMLKL